MRMVVGLGNPGSKYARTRHNAGFWVVDSLAESLGIEVKKRKFGSRLGQGELKDEKLILLKPQTYMNCSGQAVATAVGFYKLPLEDLLVAVDDMALEPGRIRLRAKGSAGSHNGLADIIEKLGTENVARLRIGIGNDERIDGYDYVLSKPGKEQWALLKKAVESAREAVLCWAEQGIETAMNKFNETKQ